MVSIEEYPFNFMNTPASLQVLASAEMGLTIWRRELANTSYLDAEERLYSGKKPRCKEVLGVPVPRRIRAQIDKKVVRMRKELEEWITFHRNRDLFENSVEAFFNNCAKHIVADFSGSIDYKATAINILNSGEFNDALNYKISCTFCLEDQVKRFWPAVANDPPIDSNDSSIDANSPWDECNLSYWNSLMKVRVENSSTDTGLVSRMMEVEVKPKTVPLQRCNETMFVYFCKMLPDDARISKIISWLKRSDCNRAVTLAGTLSTLDRVQAEKVFEQKASSIFRILMMNDNYFQFTHQLWTLMGHLVLENKSEFSDVVFELWKMAFDPHCDDLNYTRCDQINDLLLEIWSNASDELKAQVLDTFWRYELFGFSTVSTYHGRHYSRLFDRNNFASYYGHDMTFMLEVISKLRDMDKKLLWQKNCLRLALRAKPLYLEQFMRMCLSNDHQIELFKNELANFKDLFESLIREGFYADLKDYLMLCSKDAEQFQQLGKEVLESNANFILIHDDDKIAKFDWFVGEVFANVQKDMDEFKSQMVSSANCLKSLLAAHQSDCDRISSNDFSTIIRRFVNNEEELELVKRKLFEHCRTYPIDYKSYKWSSRREFNADQWQEFLVWCTGDQCDHDEISAFKRSLNVDMIFLEHLSSYLNSKSFFGGSASVSVGERGRFMSDDRDDESLSGGLNFLGEFLKWYFGNEKDAKSFKLHKIKNYKQIDILRFEMETGFIYTNGSMCSLLEWFFDDNWKNVCEFCVSCNCSIRETRRACRKNAGF